MLRLSYFKLQFTEKNVISHTFARRPGTMPLEMRFKENTCQIDHIS